MAHSSLSEGLMEIIDGGKFTIGEKFGLIEINHFCYYCTVVFKRTRADDIPENEYKIIAMKHEKPMMDHWKCDVCIIPSLSTCRKVKEYLKYSMLYKYVKPLICEKGFISLPIK